MKWALVFVAVLGIVAASNFDEKATCSANLEEEWAQYVALIPRGEILNIVITYLATDVDVQNMVYYLVSPEFEQIVLELNSEQDYLNNLDYLESLCLSVYDFLNSIHEFLGLPPIVQVVPTTAPALDDEEPRTRVHLQSLREILMYFNRKHKQVKSGGEVKGWPDMMADINAVWPKAEMQALHQNLLATSADYKKIFDGLSTQEHRDLVQKVLVLPSWMTFMADCRGAGMDIDKIKAWFQKIYGWTV